MNPTHTLVLIRHASAVRHADSDFTRELTPRGRREAEATGRWLVAERSVRPGRALVSAAVRAHTTWELLARAAGFDLAAEVDEALHSASVEALLDLVRQTPEGTGDLVVVGHNPTVSQLAQLLDCGDGDPQALETMIGGFPAGAAAEFSYPGPWSDLDLATATLAAFRPGGDVPPR